MNQLRNGVVISSHVLYIDTKEALIAFPVRHFRKKLSCTDDDTTVNHRKRCNYYVVCKTAASDATKSKFSRFFGSRYSVKLTAKW